MNVVRAFANYLQATDVATLGQDLFISRAPSSNQVIDRIFWLKAGGGSTVSKTVDGSTTKQYIIEIYHRDVNTEGVHETLQELGEDLSCAGCVTLEDYDVLEVATNGPWTDQDLDNEEREVGLLQATITIRKEC
jgi:hypothetical protein